MKILRHRIGLVSVILIIVFLGSVLLFAVRTGLLDQIGLSSEPEQGSSDSRQDSVSSAPPDSAETETPSAQETSPGNWFPTAVPESDFDVSGL